MDFPPLVDALVRDWLMILASGITVGGAANILFPGRSYGIIVDCSAGLAGTIAGRYLAWVRDDYFRSGSFAFILSFFCAVLFIAALRKLKKEI